MQTVTNVRFQLRRDTAQRWSDAFYPVLLSGEPGYDLTNNQLRIGDGSANFNNLPIVGGSGGGGGGNVPNGTIQGQYILWNGTQWVVTGTTDVRLGATTTISGSTNNTVLVGSNSTAGSADVVVGVSNTSANGENVCIGQGTESSGGDVAIGKGTRTFGNDVGLGRGVTTGGYSVSIGSASSSSSNAVSVGNASSAGGNAVSIGDSSTASGDSSVAIGTSANVTGEGSVAVGASASTLANNYAIAIGNGSLARSRFTVALGASSNTASVSENSVVIGYGATASGSTIATSEKVVVIGSGSEAAGGSNGSVVIGADTLMSSPNSIVINAVGTEPSPPSFNRASACYMRPIRGAPNTSPRAANLPYGALWYDPVTGEICFHNVA